MNTLFADIRFGFRMLKKDAAASTLAALSMALGIAAVTCILSVVHAVLVDPFPYQDFPRIVRTAIQPLKAGQFRGMHTIPEYLAIRENSRMLEDAFAMGFESLRLTDGAEPEWISGKLFSSGAFEFLGVKPLLGRTFLPDDYGNGGEPRPVIVLSYVLWQKKFASDSGVVGREVRLNGKSHTVIGVMPQRFTLFTEPSQPAVWLPLSADRNQDRPVLVHGRLKRGVSLDSAADEMHSILAPFAEENPKTFPARGFKVQLTPFSDWVRPWIRTTVYLLLAAVGCLLLIACANVANLLLARACARAREMAVRVAVGAHRRHLLKQLLTESVMLSVGGGALGVLLAVWGTNALVRLMPPGTINSEMKITVNLEVLAGAFVVSVLTGILFGLIPALHASRLDISRTLKEGEKGSSGGVSGRRTRNALIVLSFGLSMILLAGAGLMIRTFVGLSGESLGFRTDHVLTMWLPAASDTASAAVQHAGFYQRVLDQLQPAPGIKSAAFAFGFGMYGGGTSKVEVGGRAAPAEQLEATVGPVSAGYFETMGIPLLRGELFTAGEVTRGEHVAVVNQTLVQRFFTDGENPIGKSIKLARLANQRTSVDPWVRIVGVAADTKNAGPREKTIPGMYVPLNLFPSTYYMLAVRTEAAPLAALATVRARVAAVDKDQPLANVMTLEERISNATGRERFTMILLSVFAAFGLALAAIGIYGAMSYSVTQRTREIGIRVALGAGAPAVIRLVVGGGFRLALIGIVLGAFGSVAITRIISSQLYGVTATDRLSYVSVAVLLCLVGLAACYVPARRAAEIDPLSALRSE